MECNVKKLRESLRPCFAVAKDGRGMAVTRVVCLWIGDGGIQAEVRGLGKTVDVAVGSGVTRDGAFVVVAAAELKAALAAVEGDAKIGVADNGDLMIGRMRILASGVKPGDLPEIPRPFVGSLADVTEERAIYPFMEAWETVKASISADETRPHLNGVQWGNRACVSTDGHRLTAIFHGPANSDDEKCVGIMPWWIGQIIAEGKPESPVVMTTTTAKGGDGWQRYTWTDKHGANVSLISNHHIASFPPYEQVIPKSPTGRFVVRGEDLRKIAKAASKFSNERTLGIKIAYRDTNELVVSADVPTRGSAEWSLPITDGAVREDFKIGLNSRYLLDMANAIAPGKRDMIEVDFDGELDPIVGHGTVLGAECVVVLMPMRI